MIRNDDQLLTIVVPSYNDYRILDSIKSVRNFDDCGVVRLLIVDGGSEQKLVDLIGDFLVPSDILISESDKGIFDALNKGLRKCETQYLGWLGSDDWFTGCLKASEVVEALETHDLLIANTKHVRNNRVVRQTYSWPVKYKLHFLGMNCPHFSTFGRTELLSSCRFELGIRGSDIDYFLKIFRQKPKVFITSKVSTYMTEGGYSNSSYRAILRTNRELVSVYKMYLPAPFAYLAVINKLIYKTLSKVYFQFRRQYLG